MKITHPIIIWWRGIVGLGFAAGMIYSILHSLHDGGAYKMKTTLWILTSALGTFTDFWQHLFNPPTPDPTFQIDNNDKIFPDVRGRGYSSAKF